MKVRVGSGFQVLCPRHQLQLSWQRGQCAFDNLLFSHPNPPLPRPVSFPQAKAVIRSYNIDLLKGQHIPGTRQWLYSDMEKWLQLGLEEHQRSSIDEAPDLAPASSTAGSPSTIAPPSILKHKMYMLLADPGMGKSIFSAMVEAKLSERSDQGVKVVSGVSC